MTTRTSDVIYESPDGGKTIYSRKVLSIERTILTDSPSSLDIDTLNKWKKILELAKTNPTLDNQLKQVETLYELIRPRQ